MGAVESYRQLEGVAVGVITLDRHKENDSLMKHRVNKRLVTCDFTPYYRHNFIFTSHSFHVCMMGD